MGDQVGGRVALVTGAAGGIGAAVVDRLAEANGVVVAMDVAGEAGAAVADRHTAAGRRVVARQADVAERDAVEAVVADVEATIGPIDILVNVAGILRPASIVDITVDDWVDTLRVNLDGVFTVSQAVTRRMVPRGRGCVVTIGSNAAGVPRMGIAAYAASKAAAVMFTRCLGLELAGSGIRCNVVSPGSTDTAMQRALWEGGVDGDAGDAAAVIAGWPERFWSGVPLGRIATPEDVGDAVLFLASDRARHITMQNLYVDGGASLCT